MRPAHGYTSGVAALAGGLLLLSGVNPVHSAKQEGPSTLYIASYKQVGELVEVTLVNPNSTALTGTLVVEVMIDGARSLAVVPFTSWGGQKVFVSWVSPDPIDEVLRVGIIVDDGAPI